MASPSLFCSAYEEPPSSESSSFLPERMSQEDDDSMGGLVEEQNTNNHLLVVPPPQSWFDDDHEVEDEDEQCEENDDNVFPAEAYPSSSEDEDVEVGPTRRDLSNRRITPQQQPTQHDSQDDAVRTSPPQGDDDNVGTHPTTATLPPTVLYDPSSLLQITQQQQQAPSSLLLRCLPQPAPAPSWKELSSEVLPNAARELLTSSFQRLCYYSRKSYHSGLRRHRQYSDYGSSGAGYDRTHVYEYAGKDDKSINANIASLLPPFSSLPWVDRQLVQEWRTYLPTNNTTNNNNSDTSSSDLPSYQEEDDDEFDRARTLVPVTVERPVWKKADACMECHKTFGPTCLRHHCRMCGGSFCQGHSEHSHKLPHLNYGDTPERVCNSCQQILLDQHLAERVAWRMARCRDFTNGQLSPYFELGLDNLEHMALRITHAMLAMAKSIPLGAQATVAVETVDVLRKYGLNGIYTIMLRQEFLAAADLLLKALGINRTAWPLSVHELSAAIFYALAQHRAMRGMYPEQEHLVHSLNKEKDGDVHDNIKDPSSVSVCQHLPTSELKELVFYAPIALNFIYVDRSVDMQLLAAQQGWRLVYSYLDPVQDNGKVAHLHDRPASALFVHEQEKIACLAVRGTSTIHDVITDIRQVPCPFPDVENHSMTEHSKDDSNGSNEDWTTVFKGQGVAVAGMARAAMNLYQEHIDPLMALAKQGYRIRMTGHSLGGSVSTLLGVLVYKDLAQLMGTGVEPPLKVFAYGSPSCVDLELSKAVEPFVTTVVLHDDVVPRLTPTSCRGLLKHLLHIRETWVKEHFADDIRAFTDRAKTAWAPRWRGGFTLSSASSSSIKLKRYCHKKIQFGKKQLRFVKDKLVGDESSPYGPGKATIVDQEVDYPETVSWTSTSNIINSNIGSIESSEHPPRLVMDIMGGMDAGTEGMVVDGDEFFDPNEHLLESSSDDESETTTGILDERMAVQANEDSQIAAACVDPSDGTDTSLEKIESIDSGEEDDSPSAAVVLEETPLPKMFIPGRIVHVYSHRGIYKAAYVPRDFRELRRISLAGNMLSDHKTKSYYDALLEVGSVRGSSEQAPRWTAFDEDDTCSCCASRFTWASTSDNEAQEARDKHNCRSCGSLVCEPCSHNRIPIPSIGLTVPARVCDRCYNDMDGLVKKPTPERTETEAAITEESIDDNNKPIRQREKRSAVVDDLASRVQTSALTTCS